MGPGGVRRGSGVEPAGTPFGSRYLLGPVIGQGAKSDLNGDHEVDFSDLRMLLASLGGHACE
jgi:hypothetical protein